jgi:hypothetical protein
VGSDGIKVYEKVELEGATTGTGKSRSSSEMLKVTYDGSYVVENLSPEAAGITQSTGDSDSDK